MKFIAIILSILVFSACGGETSSKPVEEETFSTPAPTADEVFLTVLRNETDAWDAVDDALVVDLAHKMCDAWESGASMHDIGGVMMELGYDAYEAGFFMGAGTETYCPEYSGVFESPSSNT